jgi:hypothetical protein
MTLLREADGGYGQRNPLYEYKQDAFTCSKLVKNY